MSPRENPAAAFGPCEGCTTPVACGARERCRKPRVVKTVEGVPPEALERAAASIHERVFAPIFDRLDAEKFAEEAQAAREFFEPRGFRVHVSTNDRRIVMVRDAS